VAAGQVWSRQHTPHSIAWLPAGKAAVSTQSTEKFSWLLQHTRPGDLFLQGQGSDLYLPLELRSATFVDYLWNNEVTRPEYVALTLQQMERQQVKYILWSQRLLSDSEQHSDGQDSLDPFRTFMTTRYRRVHVFANGDEIWERR